MTLWILIRRSLRFHARSHLGVVLGAAVGSAALIGALIVGDSVRESLREQALQRLGGIELAVAPSDRFFRESLRLDLENAIRSGTFIPQGVYGRPAPALIRSYKGESVTTAVSCSATAVRQDGAARANRVQVISLGPGLDQFGRMPGLTNFGPGDIILNLALAQQLKAGPGDVIVLRMRKPSMLSPDVPISPAGDSAVALRLRVHSIMAAKNMGDFSLVASQVPPHNAFVRADTLQSALGLQDRANVLLAGPLRNVPPPAAPRSQFVEKFVEFWRGLFPTKLTGAVATPLGEAIPTAEAQAFFSAALRAWWQLADAAVEVRELPDLNAVELRSPRIFLDPPVVRAAFVAHTNAAAIITYLVNQFRTGTNTTPYSMVAAAGPPYTAAKLRDDEIIINQWLADDLLAKPGDEVVLTYFLPDSAARLAEATNRFRVHSIVPMTLPHADRNLMPDFPGLAKAESTHDWDAGFPLVHKIRDQDDKYWKHWRGTPKAFVTLAAGQSMWGNRFGNVTAIRYPLPAGEDAAAFRTNVERSLLLNIDPAALGLRFEPVRAQALKAASGSQDFGGLFIGFSFFLIGGALILMGLLFQFGIEQRAAEIGTLLALGWEPRRVRRLFLLEGMALALVGGALGAVGGIYYARALLHGLTTVWREAVGASALTYHATPQTLLIGFASAVIVSAITIWLVLRKLGRRPARELLTGETQSPKFKARSWWRLVALIAGVLTAGLVGWAVWAKETANPGIFFSAGALCLIATLGAAAWWLGRLQGLGSGAGVPPVFTGVSPVKSPSEIRGETPQDTGGTPAPLTLRSLGLRGTARRRTRSLATITLLACGSFLIASIGINRLDANLHAEKRSSGTGGFALIGESTLPMVKDLNTREGREALGLDDKILQGVSFVPFRVRTGDDASCLNLNRAQTPRLLGVKAGMMDGRFTLARGEGWRSLINTGLKPGDRASANAGNRLSGLSTPSQAGTGLKPGVNENEVSAIADDASIQWALHKKIGDSLEFTDEHGQKFSTKLVGSLANSILQGSLIIDEAEFVKRFPGESGYRMFLIDCPSNALPKVSAELSRALQDYGFEVTPAARRLAQFNAVQNTYLNTFQLLGGLGLLLGSAGLGVVVLRNVLERRGELALLLAVGFERGALQRLVLAEHAALLVLGLGAGLVSAVVSVLPTVLSPTATFPLGSLALTLGAVFVTGLLATWLATRWALRGNLLEGLRNE